MLRLLRRLPAPVKAFLIRAVEGLGAWPLRVRAGPARGLVLTAPLTRWSQYAGGRHEAHVADAMVSILEADMVACDVGAHFGYLSLVMAARVGDGGQVFSFEPVAHHAGLLQRTVARNHLAQVTVIEQALGATEAEARILAGPTDAMGRTEPADPGSTPTAERPTVSMTTLDAWLAERDLAQLDLIKIDVEGSELDVLAGAEGVLKRFRPAVVCEVHWSRSVQYRPRELIRWLEAAGYRVELLRRRDQQKVKLESILRQTDAAEAPEHMVIFHVLALPTN